MRILDHKGALLRATGAACLIVVAWSALGSGPEQPPLNRGLKILYAGRPGSDREKDFVSFLKQYFDVVQAGNLQTFKETDTQGFDVTLLDWDWNEFEFRRPRVSEGFSRPVLTLGVAGAQIASQWNLKTGYL